MAELKLIKKVSDTEAYEKHIIYDPETGLIESEDVKLIDNLASYLQKKKESKPVEKHKVPSALEYRATLKALGVKLEQKDGAIHVKEVPPELLKMYTFFSKSSPCPYEGDCEELREEYFKELALLESTPNCPDCAKGKLNRKYQMILMQKMGVTHNK